MRCVPSVSGADGRGGWYGRQVELPAVPGPRPVGEPATSVDRTALQRAMTLGAGMLRDEASLRSAGDAAMALRTADDIELANLAIVATALVTAATERAESRGAHTRVDHPEHDDELGRTRLVF
jgi:L-aspartate oxidase